MASDLNSFHPEEYRCWLLQYGDDLLLAPETKEKCWEGTKALLQLLMEAGYWVSKKKAQICKEEVRYLGFALKKDAVMPRVRVPKTERIRCPQQCKSIKGFVTSSSQGPGFIQHSGIRQGPRVLNHLYFYTDGSLFL